MRNRSTVIALVAAVLLGAGGYWWVRNEPPASAAVVLSPAAGTARRTGGNLAGQAGGQRRYGSLGNYGYPGSLSYRGGGSLADRLPRGNTPLIRQIRPLSGGSVFGYVLPDGGGGFLLQFVCDGTGPVYITSTAPAGATSTTALECADASSVRSFRYVGPAALRVASHPRSNGQIAIQVIHLGP